LPGSNSGSSELELKSPARRSSRGSEPGKTKNSIETATANASDLDQQQAATSSPSSVMALTSTSRTSMSSSSYQAMRSGAATTEEKDDGKLDEKHRKKKKGAPRAPSSSSGSTSSNSQDADNEKEKAEVDRGDPEKEEDKGANKERTRVRAENANVDVAARMLPPSPPLRSIPSVLPDEKKSADDDESEERSSTPVPWTAPPPPLLSSSRASLMDSDEEGSTEGVAPPPPALLFQSSRPAIGSLMDSDDEREEEQQETCVGDDNGEPGEASVPLPPPPLQRRISNRSKANEKNVNDQGEASMPFPPPPLQRRDSKSSNQGEASMPLPPSPLGRRGSSRSTGKASSASMPPCSPSAAPPHDSKKRAQRKEKKIDHIPIDVDAFMGLSDSDDDSSIPSQFLETPPPLLERSRSNNSYGSRRSNASCEAKVPMPPMPARTPSQDAAVAAVLGNNDDIALKKNSISGVELTDEELGAAITPELRRHSDSNSTPGAFRAGGDGSGGVVPPPDNVARVSSGSAAMSVLTRNASTDSRNIQQAEASVADSCTTLVSATLVAVDSYTEAPSSSKSRNNDPPPPILAHAEPLWKKRRIVLCLSVWALAAVAVVAVSVSVALAITGKIGVSDDGNPGSSGSSDPDFAGASGDEGEDSPVAPTPSPAANNTTNIDYGSISSSHVVSWGKISTCNDPDYFALPEYNLHLRCGGKLDLIDIENAECQTVPFTGFPGIADQSRLSCQLNVPDEPLLTDGGSFYQEVMGVVIFTCTGETDIDRTASAELPTATVNNCTVAGPSDSSGGRRLTTTVTASSSPDSSSYHSSRARALQEVELNGGAASFISMGRYCLESYGWVLWHENYPCELGDRLTVIPDIGDFYQSENGGTDSSTGDLLSDLLNSLFGIRRRRLGRRLQFDDILGSAAKEADAEVFCFREENCADQAELNAAECENDPESAACFDDGCSFALATVRMSDADNRGWCAYQVDEGPSLAEMTALAEEEFNPYKFIDRISGEL